MGIAAALVQVRNSENHGVQTSNGPFLSAALPIASFSLIEVRDLEEAIALAAKSPCAVAHGVIEVWPLRE